jgi:hypothetical protein
MSAMNLVLGNCSNIIFKNTVIGMHMIIPGTPQINPNNINITNTVMTLIENDFPMNTGSKMDPKRS